MPVIGEGETLLDCLRVLTPSDLTLAHGLCIYLVIVSGWYRRVCMLMPAFDKEIGV